MIRQINYKVSSFLFFVCLSSIVFGQTITILSSEDSQPIPKARIDLSTSISQEVFHFQTSTNGKWKLEERFQNRSITLKISFTGFQTKIVENIYIKNDTLITLLNEVKEYEEIAITAQYKTRLIENAVHDIKVIDRKKIELMAAQDLGDVLSNELNIRINKDDILGNTMQLQGIGGENVKILIDDVPLTGRMNGNIDLSQIMLDNVERIEIVEGPLSVNYGTDALAGTINIITKKTQKNKLEGVTNNYFESSGKINNSLSLGWQQKKHHIRLETGRRFFDGWDPSHKTFHLNRNPVADSTRVQLWNPKIQVFGGLNYRYHHKNSIFNYSGQLFNEDIINKGKPRPPYQELAFDDYYNTKRIYQRGFFEYRFKNDYRMAFVAAYNGYLRRKNTMVRDLTEINDVLSTDKNDHDTSQFHSFILQGKMIQSKPNKQFNYEVGYDILHEIATGKRMLDSKQANSDYALFVTSEYAPINKLIIRPGIRYGYNTNYKTPLTPSIHLKYDFYETNHHHFKIRTSYAKGFRSPSIKELHYTFVDVNHNITGNPDLKAENADNYNLSIHHEFKASTFKIRNKISGFYTHIQQMISLALTDDYLTQYSYFNLDKFTSKGIQFENNLTWNNLSTNLGASYIGRNSYLEQNSETKRSAFIFSPEFKLNIQYTLKKWGIQTAFFYKYTGILPSFYKNEDGEIETNNIGDYHTGDFTVSKNLWKNKISISAGVKNIFDVKTIPGSTNTNNIVEIAHSSSNSGINVGMGRTFHFGFRLNLNSK